MMNFIDRRLNPKGKSLGNRQRFLRRARQQIMEAVRDASAKRGISDLAGGDRITIPADGVREPTFHASGTGGQRQYVLPGNREFSTGDRIPRPEGGGSGAGGSEPSADGLGEDAFQFVLTREEFLDLFLEDLELPDLVKKNLKQSSSTSLTRAGYSVTGSPANLSIVRTMRNSLSRRIALHRPRPADIAAAEAAIADAIERGVAEEEVARLKETLERQARRSVTIPFIDPIDVRYNRFQQVPKPVTRAVMFCLMDVSGSMTEHMKDLAKRFFMLLYLFLEQRYKQVDLVFIRHTHEAKEVDERTFFYSTETGGTVVSTALLEMERVIADRYPVGDWNIYAAQASDGDNLTSDNARARSLLSDVILPACQYFAYLEVAAEQSDRPGRDTALWRTYGEVARDAGEAFAMRRVHSRSEIFPVFRELFARDRAAAGR